MTNAFVWWVGDVMSAKGIEHSTVRPLYYRYRRRLPHCSAQKHSLLESQHMSEIEGVVADEGELEVLVEEEKNNKRDQVIQDLMNELKYREQLYVLTSMHYHFKDMLFVIPILVAGTGKRRCWAALPMSNPDPGKACPNAAIRLRSQLINDNCQQNDVPTHAEVYRGSCCFWCLSECLSRHQ